MSDRLVGLQDVSFSYGEGPTLTSVDLDVGAGDLIGVVGPSGAGKTTLLKLLSGAETPLAGSRTAVDGLRIGWVPQVETVNWYFPVTVDEVVLMGATAGGSMPWYTRAERRRTHDLLHDLGLGHLEGRHIRRLSGGQQQRVFVARALISEPDLIILDEPLSGVDVRTRQEVLDLLEILAGRGIAIVLTTHDLNGVAAHLPRIVCVNGRIVSDGSPLETMTTANMFETFGASMDVIMHESHPIVIDRHDPDRTIRLRELDRGSA